MWGKSRKKFVALRILRVGRYLLCAVFLHSAPQLVLGSSAPEPNILCYFFSRFVMFYSIAKCSTYMHINRYILPSKHKHKHLEEADVCNR